MNRTSWKEIMLGAIAGLSLLTTPAMGKMTDSIEDSAARIDNQGPGSLNSGSGSIHSGRNEGKHRGRDGRDALMVAQVGDDIRQDDQRADRREDRRLDRREDRREDRQTDRRKGHRSNAGGELRSLGRADQVAGEHGRERRENARMMQTERSNVPDRIDQMQRLDRPERPIRAERPERTERSGRQ